MFAAKKFRKCYKKHKVENKNHPLFCLSETNAIITFSLTDCFLSIYEHIDTDFYKVKMRSCYTYNLVNCLLIEQ